MKNDTRNPHAQLVFEERMSLARARLLHVWGDRGWLAWLPWLIAAAVLFGAAKNFFQWLGG